MRPRRRYYRQRNYRPRTGYVAPSVPKPENPWLIGIVTLLSSPIYLVLFAVWSPFILLLAAYKLFEFVSTHQEERQTTTGQATASPEAPVTTDAFKSIEPKPPRLGSRDLSPAAWLGVAALAACPVVAFVVLSSNNAAVSRRGGGGGGVAYAPSPQSVYVPSYRRDDGVRVREHYRSYPDSSKENNWSTYPNVNPFTGERGSKRESDNSPSELPSIRKTEATGSSSGGATEPLPLDPLDSVPTMSSDATAAERPSDSVEPSDSTSEGIARSDSYQSVRRPVSSYDVTAKTGDERRRKQLGLDLNGRAIGLDWRQHSEDELRGFLERARQAGEISRLGFTVRWQDHTLAELQELTERAKYCNYLKEQGYQFDWQKPSMVELRDVVVRVTLANELSKKEGFLRDWRNHDVESLVRLVEDADRRVAQSSLSYPSAQRSPSSPFRERPRRISSNP